MRSSFVDTLISKARVDKDIVLITGDLGSGCLEKFENEFPERYFNLGIAEQNMIGVAAGLAMEGKKVFIYSIGNFNTLRVLEQIRNDVCYMNLNVNIISVGAGLEYGQLGFSHHATEDVACMRAMPNMVVFDPATVNEAIMATKIMAEIPSPTYMRLNKKGVELNVKAPSSMQPYLIKAGKDIAIFTSGAILSEGLKASEMLKNEGLDVAVYSTPAVKPLNARNLIKILLGYKRVYTLEEHTVIGGLGSAFAEILAPVKEAKPTLNILGIKDCFSSTVGDRAYLRKEYKIDAKSVAEEIKKNK